MTTATSQPSCSSATSQNVTLPPIPELFDPDFLNVLIPSEQDSLAPMAEVGEWPSNPMMDALRSTAHHKLTANSAPAFSSTLVHTLDAYLGLRTGIPGLFVDNYLDKAWKEDPDLTLRIIWSTRSIHEGKAEKELFYRAFGWLFENHPRTAITNLHCLVDPVCIRSSKDTKKSASHGYWKDLLNILALATVDELKPKSHLAPRSNFLHNYCLPGSRPYFVDNQAQEEWSRTQRIKRSQSAHARLVQKLLDKRYRALYVAVARLFAGQLAKEHDVMKKIIALPPDAEKGDRMELIHALTLALKWAPTPGGSHDRVTNISSAISLLLYEAQVTVPISHRIPFSATSSLPTFDMYLLRYIYQKYLLTPGRRYIHVPEPLMSSNHWSEIIYSRVSSICMSKKKEKFLAHDEGRFLNYLQEVESGKKHISGATLLPHVLVMEAAEIYRRHNSTIRNTRRTLSNAQHELAKAQSRVVDAQWATLVGRLRESGHLDNCIAVCDVSGSMGSVDQTKRSKSAFNVEPIWPALSLSLLVARLAKAPFNDSFITFSLLPEFVALDPEPKHVSLGATIHAMHKSKWQMNTDFNAVFLKLILPLAIKHNVPKEDMIKRVFVFTDMQFDSASSTRDSVAEWETNHDIVVGAYTKAGYDVPELVYWDLSNPRNGFGITAPVTGKKEGVALLSGYSPSLLKVFMGSEEEDWEMLDEESKPQSVRQSLTPEEVMKKALGRKSYDGLVVVD